MRGKEMKQIGLRSYQDIKTPEDLYEEDLVQACYEELCERYADEIEDQGMNRMQKANLMKAARQMARKRMEIDWMESQQ